MSADQIILIGLVASAITWGLRFASQFSKKWKPSRVSLTAFLYFVSAGLAFAWSGAVAPPLPAWSGDVLAFVSDSWRFVNAWVALASPILGSATLIYNLLYEKVVVPAFKKYVRAG